MTSAKGVVMPCGGEVKDFWLFREEGTVKTIDGLCLIHVSATRKDEVFHKTRRALRMSFSGDKFGAGFFDAMLSFFGFFSCVDPVGEVSSFVGGESAPGCFCFGVVAEGFVKIHGNDGVAAGAALAGCEFAAGNFDATRTRFGLFCGVNPAEKISLCDGGDVVPKCFPFWSCGESFLEIGGKGG